ncbi:nitrous oxide reductase accessory protein NosL [Bacillus pseudomycoides]|uniref:nitrous oxide reductase accessory protein NosL n=1 Tax=Bacillus pseudomycoides TaxID=64104 RepID=UPI0011A05933|nr:nitrous oxide reductase accessory protein NosL [Bacillus pseudomycoides]
MKIKNVVFVMCMCLVFAVVGCGKKGAEPVAVDEKNDKCDVCNMAVMDNQFATEVILENGKALKFDDIGCMYKWMDEHKNEKTQEKFVRDYHTKDWISLDKATYVYDKTIKTPMAYNVISFKEKKDAENFVSKHAGKVLSYKELTDHKWEMNKEMMGKMKKEHGKENNSGHSH